MIKIQRYLLFISGITCLKISQPNDSNFSISKINKNIKQSLSTGYFITKINEDRQLIKLPGLEISGKSFNVHKKDNANLGLEYINGYGCWCNFEKIELGITVGGEPQDYLDRQCYKLFQNYYCGGANNDEDSCHLEDTIYKDDLTAEYLTSSIIYKIMSEIIPGKLKDSKRYFDTAKRRCRTKNRSNSCAVKACLIESKFLYDIAPGVYYKNHEHVNGVNPLLKRSNGFDFNKVCLGIKENKVENDRRRGFKTSIPSDNETKNFNIKEQNLRLVMSPLLNQDNINQEIINTLLENDYFDVDKDPNFIDSFTETGNKGLGIKNQIFQSGNFKCCGSLPNYMLYNSDRNDVECCNNANSLYNPVTQCCRGNQISSCY